MLWVFKNAFSSPSQPTKAQPAKAEAAQKVKPNPQDLKEKVAEAGEKLNTASNPKPPITTEADRIHQFKKEASVQQAP